MFTPSDPPGIIGCVGINSRPKKRLHSVARIPEYRNCLQFPDHHETKPRQICGSNRQFQNQNQ
jgi:hypothetical protein